MSKLNEIQNKLRELDGAVFQKLVDAYLVKEGFRNLVPVGSVAGKNKVRPGTPDALNAEGDGTFTFIEHTTTGLTRLLEKLLNDLAKCVDTSKTGIPVDRIHEVILTFPHDLSSADCAVLQAAAEQHAVRVRPIGLQTLSFDLRTKYPDLAHDFLGVSVDTGQIMSIDAFVTRSERNKLAPPLATELLGREDELGSVVTALETTQVVVLTGNPGVGKSRLALEGLRKFTLDHPEWQAYCVVSQGVDAFADIRTYFSPPGNYAILVDDANRERLLDYVVNDVLDAPEGRNFRIIATVRRYARGEVLRVAEQLAKPAVLDVLPLPAPTIEALVTNHFGFPKGGLLIEHINRLSSGNPRIAMMVGAVVKEQRTWESLNNITDVYDRFFGTVLDDVPVRGTHLMKVAAVIGFLGAVDRANEAQLAKLVDAFQIDRSAFWDHVQQLNELELVDVFEGELAKVSEQLFATYAFYRACFVEKTIDFERLFAHYFPDLRSRIVEVLNPCLNAFDHEAILRQTKPTLERAWQRFLEAGDVANLCLLMKQHPYELKARILVYLKSVIDRLPEDNTFATTTPLTPFHPSQSPLLEILAGFNNAPEAERNIALELIFEYLVRVPEDIEQVRELIRTRFGIRHYAHELGYTTPRAVVKVLERVLSTHTEESLGKLYLGIARDYLQFEFHTTMTSGRSTIRIVNFTVPSTNDLRLLRDQLIDGTLRVTQQFSLYCELTDFLHRYASDISADTDHTLIEPDARRLVPGLVRLTPPANLALRAEAQRYFDRLKGCGIGWTEQARAQLDHSDLEIIRGLLQQPREEYTGYEAEEQRRRDRLWNLTRDYNQRDFAHLFAVCLSFLAQSPGAASAGNIGRAVTDVFELLAQHKPNLFAKVLEDYLQAGEPLELVHPPLRELLVTVGAREAIKLLDRCAFSGQGSWVLRLLLCTPVGEREDAQEQRMLRLFRELPLLTLPSPWHILSARKDDGNVLLEIARLIEARCQETQPDRCPVAERLFSCDKAAQQLLNCAPELCERLYLLVTSRDPSADYDAEYFNSFQDRDPTFVERYLESRTGRFSRYDDHRMYDSVWLRQDYIDVFNRVLDWGFRDERSRGREHALAFFLKVSNRPKAEEVWRRQESFLDQRIKRHAADRRAMQLVFETIVDWPEHRRRERLKVFLEHNLSFVDFETLPLLPSGAQWSGSAVPVYRAKAAYLNSLLDLLVGVQFLEHREYVDRLMSWENATAEHHRRHDFIEDRFEP